MPRHLAHRQVSEDTKCSALQMIIDSLRVDRENVEYPKFVLPGTLPPVPLYRLPGSRPIVEASA